MTTRPHTAEAFEDLSFGQPAVRGFLHRTAIASHGALVLTHGAGGNCKVPLLVAVADAFAARGITVLRCDLPYRQARPTGPPSPSRAAVDREGLKHAVLALGRIAPRPMVLGGHSYGGRQASMLLAGDAGLADRLLLMSYPLHPPGRPDQARTAHLSALRTPTFFVHGAADTFASRDEIEAARSLVPAPTGIVSLERAGHDLYPGRRRPGLAEQVADRIATEFLAWGQALTP